MSAEWVRRLDELVQKGEWATYATMSEVVYGHRKGSQAIGTALRMTPPDVKAHRILRAGGKVSGDWQGVDTHRLGGGAPEAVERLREEGVWDEARGCARARHEVHAETIRERLAAPHRA
jgi:hypothetical protein